MRSGSSLVKNCYSPPFLDFSSGARMWAVKIFYTSQQNNIELPKACRYAVVNSGLVKCPLFCQHLTQQEAWVKDARKFVSCECSVGWLRAVTVQAMCVADWAHQRKFIAVTWIKWVSGSLATMRNAQLICQHNAVCTDQRCRNKHCHWFTKGIMASAHRCTHSVLQKLQLGGIYHHHCIQHANCVVDLCVACT